ncbi:PorP/SprF family type IX secretion system membrane protein [Aestuariibaculum sediminum]|uniref:Type IX secretion system membrane protein PorP/SprF n=1 Tax=Aestuariibaculum sediminum TaxID=2770637 RepID=A0A8J6Q918_9FLAO|nr:type IX secretion system membrane protein PorP/SprF [Aestuariibaculum sediminum]MBD0830511.1 type IX secretion system membrane protein PorP/SprF [Aestuariibaculum sediminum]
MRSTFYKVTIIIVLLLMYKKQYAQQDPQYTQYMYNTMSVNPGYAGQREVLNVTGLYRTQWVGLDGAPETQTFAVHSPLRNENIGLGFSVVNDKLGPSSEVYADANFSYTTPLDNNFTKLSFGLKTGFHNLNLDWSKGIYQDPDLLFNQPVNLWSPSIGAGIYLHSRKWYVGLSVPNFITTNHYDDFQESVAAERMHYFLIGGYVMYLSDDLALKPAFLVKAVSGAPLIADVSANLLIKEKVTLGLAWRWDDSVSALVGFQVSNNVYIGYAYDLTSTHLNNYNSGTHEIMIRFEPSIRRLISPRFF